MILQTLMLMVRGGYGSEGAPAPQLGPWYQSKYGKTVPKSQYNPAILARESDGWLKAMFNDYIGQLQQIPYSSTKPSNREIAQMEINAEHLRLEIERRKKIQEARTKQTGGT